MKDVMEDYLKIVAPHISHQLISPESLGHISSIARMLPASLSSYFIFECRLGEVQPAADFSLYLPASEGGRQILAGHHSAIDLPSNLLTNSVWSNLRQFCSHWANPASLLYEKIQRLWLEFDVVDEPLQVPVPSIFFGAQGIESNNPKSTKSEITANHHQWVTETALRLLCGTPIPARVEQKIFDCFNLLPKDACVFHIGVMLARQVDSVRLCIKIPLDKISDYLTKISWSGEITKIEAIVSKLSGLFDRIVLALDVGDSIFPNLGLECFLSRQSQPDPRWQLPLDYFVETGICLPTKRDAILAYPGYSHERSNRELWPGELLRMSHLFGPRVRSVLVRAINHIKLVYKPNSPLTAKAYLVASHHWVTRIGSSIDYLESQPVELDSWQEYTLLRVDNSFTSKSVYFLRMTCPSTGFHHVLCVPPDVMSVREAISWLKHGTWQNRATNFFYTRRY